MKILVIGTKEFGEALFRVFSNVKPQVQSESTEARIQEALKKKNFDIIFFDDDVKFHFDSQKLPKIFSLIRQSKKSCIVVSSNHDFSHIVRMRDMGATDYLIRPYNDREFILRANAVYQKKKRIVCIGGGTGLFHLLMGLKHMPQTLLTSLVSISDDGGSSGKLSESLGVLPPGDIRRSLVAMSNAPEIMNQIMQYRFEKKGDLEGHSFGNIFLAVLAEVKGSMSEAVRALSDILYLQGIVLPASKTLTRLVAEFEGGVLIRGESKIDRCEDRDEKLKIERLWHEPEVEADFNALVAILFSDYVTIGPGDLFTSIVTNLVVKHVREALQKTSAKKIYICNLMTKPGETFGYDAVDHVREINKYLGGDWLDFVIISTTKFSRDSVVEYAKKSQDPVVLRDQTQLLKITKARMVAVDVGSAEELVRHDSQKLREALELIIGFWP